MKTSTTPITTHEVYPQLQHDGQQAISISAFSVNEVNLLHYTVFDFLKRIFDVVFSLVVIVTVLSWLLPLLTIVIKATSKGPVFFKQKRTGFKGKEFYCYKLRTMHVNVEADTQQANNNDTRTTKPGKFLRNTNIDELPQFFNVLMGDMSVVGPRPHMVYHTIQFSRQIKEYPLRHYVKPGVTGLAQVKGWRGPTPAIRHIYKRVQWDVYYVKHRGILLDSYILFATIGSVFYSFYKAISNN